MLRDLSLLAMYLSCESMTRIVKSFSLSDSGPPGQKEPGTLILVPCNLIYGGFRDFVRGLRRKLPAMILANSLTSRQVNECSRDLVYLLHLPISSYIVLVLVPTVSRYQHTVADVVLVQVPRYFFKVLGTVGQKKEPDSGISKISKSEAVRKTVKSRAGPG